jgi:hypothetical protein
MSDEDVMYELVLDVPGAPKGEPFQIVGLGTFENGNTYTVTKAEADAYRQFHSRTVPVVNEEDQAIVGSNVQLGPTLLQDSKNMYGVEVATVDPDTKARSTKKSTTVTDDDTSDRTPSNSLAEAEKPDHDKADDASQHKVVTTDTTTKSTKGGDKS